MRAERSLEKCARFIFTASLAAALFAARPIAGGQAAPADVSRPYDPVVLSGAQFQSLQGAPLAQLYIYADRGAGLEQIPFQWDERDANGAYLVHEDGRLDSNDELIFMAADAGSFSPDPLIDVGGAELAPAYVLAIRDPLDGGRSWAYLFQAEGLNYFGKDYVNYDPANDRLISNGVYQVGFDPDHGFRSRIILGDSGTDLLDRDKYRVSGSISFFPLPEILFSLTEDDLIQQGVRVIDGPVRVTRVATLTLSLAGEQFKASTPLFAYPALITQPAISLTVPSENLTIDLVRFSTDWNAAAAGMKYFDSNTLSGVIVDGSPDAVPAGPFSPWRQFAGDQGSVVAVASIPENVKGQVVNYYRDDSTPNPSDTGDELSFGDAGVQIEAPQTGAYQVNGATYFLPGESTSVGSTYQDYWENPLEVQVVPLAGRRILLPVVIR